MNSGIVALEHSYQFIFTGVLIVLAIMLFFCLLRACLGPTVADRFVSINMMGTIVIVMIAVLAIVKNEGYLVDISLIYAMMSFLAVIVLSKVIIGIYNEKAAKDKTITELKEQNECNRSEEVCNIENKDAINNSDEDKNKSKQKGEIAK